MKKKRKSIRSLAEELKKIRRCPIPQEQIDEFNKIMEEAEPSKHDNEMPNKKIAHPRETNI